MIAILILVEMIGSARLGKQQRRLLKQERRRLEQAKLDLEATGSISEQGPASVSGASTGRRGNEGGWRMDSREGLLSDSDSEHAADAAQVEIVRPPSVGAAQVIYNQQLMYEMYQRQYHQHQQQFLMSQQLRGLESNTTGPVGADEEGKYDDLLLESSYKFEIPMDGPLEGSSSAQTSAPVSVLAGTKAKIHPPSALSSAKTPSSTEFSVTTAQTPTLSTSIQPKRRPLSTAKDNIPQDTARILKDTSPFAKGGGYAAIQEVASAPPAESWSESSLPPSQTSQQAPLNSIPNPAPSVSPSPVSGPGRLRENT
ncbi:hypothetical protein BGZ72_008631 [Mortierella alpina]|nr:hypothetical protein BGZ72_008631 [Mortierella alpina]